MQRTRAILAAYSPVCAIRVSTRAATSTAALSVIFFRLFLREISGWILTPRLNSVNWTDVFLFSFFFSFSCEEGSRTRVRTLKF